MGQPLVIYALVAKRAELSGQVLDLERQKAVLKAQLQTIDEALAIFGYARSPDDIKRDTFDPTLERPVEA